MSKFKFFLAIIGVIFTWVLVVPIFEFPDEQAHFETVEFVASHGRVSVGNELDMTQEMKTAQTILGVFRNPLGQNLYTYHPEYHVEYGPSLTGLYEPDILSLNNKEARSTYVGSEAAKYPPLYYHFTALFMRGVNGQDLITRLYASRLSGLFIVLAMSVVIWQIGILLFGKAIYARTLVLLTMLQPMMSFVTAGVNSDNLHNLWFMCIIYFCLRIIKSGLDVRSLVILTLLTTLDIYTKPQGLIAVPVIAVAVLIAIIIHRSWRSLLWILVLAVTAIALGFNQWRQYLGLFSVANNHGAEFIEYLRFSANKLVAQNVVWYWGVFKWLGVVLPPIYWRVANRVVLLSFVGILVYLWRVLKRKKLLINLSAFIFLLSCSLIYALVIFWYDWQYLKIEGFSLGIQARYFFPTLVAHMALLMTGILSLGWSVRSRIWFRRVLIALLLWLQLGGLWRIITIYYDTSSLTVLITQLSQYKPVFAKGNWWYLWGTIYLSSLLYLVKTSLWPGTAVVGRRRQKSDSGMVR